MSITTRETQEKTKMPRVNVDLLLKVKEKILSAPEALLISYRELAVGDPLDRGSYAKAALGLIYAK